MRGTIGAATARLPGCSESKWAPRNRTRCAHKLQGVFRKPPKHAERRQHDGATTGAHTLIGPRRARDAETAQRQVYQQQQQGKAKALGTRRIKPTTSPRSWAKGEDRARAVTNSVTRNGDTGQLTNKLQCQGEMGSVKQRTQRQGARSPRSRETSA